jgi:short-chain fatty acids transporter
MSSLSALGLRARRGFARVVPDPFAIAVALTVVVAIAALVAGRAPLDVVRDFGRADGLWRLLVFTMQMCTMLVLGTALAAAPQVQRGIVWAVEGARGPRQLVGTTAFVAIGLALVNWSLGLVGGALFAREAGRIAKRKGWALHYPILCAAGYTGLMTWHGGLSGSAPLKVATEAGMVEILGAPLAAAAGGAIPLSSTLFGRLNVIVSVGLWLLGPLLMMALTPRAGEDPDPVAAPDRPGDEPAAAVTAPGDTAIERWERSPLVSAALALLMAAAIGAFIADEGLDHVGFNEVNLALWCAALVLHGRPDRFIAACEEGARGCTGIILQFPLYGGIMGMMVGSGLSASLSGWFARASAGAFGVWTFLAAGLLNLLVPSGGGQWAVQGPVLVEAALRVGAPLPTVVMAMSYGDQWTNMLQPFWALPLLAITGVRARDIIGYTAIWMAVGGAWIVAALLLFG